MAETAALRDLAWARESVTTPETTRQAQMGKIFGYLKGLHATHLMELGTSLGLFGELAAHPSGLLPDALASALGLHLPYVRSWCETACTLELLDYDPVAGYRFAPFMDELLAQEDATFYLGLFPAVHLQIERDYARYPELFRSGGVYSYQKHDEPFLRSVAEALRTLPRIVVEAVLPNLPDLRARLERGAAILDVGCGGGYAMVEFAERFPNVRCVGLDVEPTSIDMARDLIRSRGLDDRVAAHLVGSDEWPEETTGVFDLATMFLVLHEIRPDLKGRVLERCARALRPGGQLLIFDEAYPAGPEQVRDPALGLVVMAQWYELVWGNVMNTRDEIHALLAAHGLRIRDETSLSRFYIAVADKG
jgi:SAM-dependent methyltransferase